MAEKRDAGVPNPARKNYCSCFRRKRNYSLWLPLLIPSSL